MKFGLSQERQAAERYRSFLSDDDVTLTHSGLRVSKEFPFLGASADAVIQTKEGKRLVEFKNPLSTWLLSIEEAVKKLACLKLDENNRPTLNKKDKYYTQIQGQMGVYKIHTCDFVLCTEKDIFVETVTFDENMWNEMTTKLKKFYVSCLLPEIVYPSLKYGNEMIVFK